MARFLNNPSYRGVEGERFVWDLCEPLWFRDNQGRAWCMPEGFRHDKRSSPWFLWNWAPPSTGQADRPWTFHDFMQRCFELLGLKQSEVDGDLFRQAMLAVGKSERRAVWHSRAVRLGAFLLGTGDGNGVHRDERFNAPVWCREAKRQMPLKTWVELHYKPDGKGYREKVLPVDS